MIRANFPRDWNEVPPFVVVRILRQLRAGAVYGPQDFTPPLADLALGTHTSHGDELIAAIEGFDLAVRIGDALSLDYGVYNDEQETIRSIERAAIYRLHHSPSSPWN